MIPESNDSNGEEPVQKGKTDRPEEPDRLPDLSELSDAELIGRLKKGEEGAYAVLAGRYEPLTESAVRRFIPSFAGLTGEAVWGEDDLRQCAALALYRAAMTYDAEKYGDTVRFGLYAKTCVKNALISELRKAGTESAKAAKLRERSRRAAKRSDFTEALISAEGASALTSSIRSALSPMERDVFDRYITGMSVEQIARLLGRDRKSVSNALYRMKVKIKGLLQNDP